MAFVLPARNGNKRAKYIGPDGAQVPQEDRRWHWLQAHLTQKLAQGGKEEAKDEEASERIEPKQLTPREALERIHAARGEIDVILDLVNGIEDGQHLAIGMVTPSQKSLQAQNRERGLALSAKHTQLQGAADRLRQGAELMAKQMDQDDHYFSAAAQLQKQWKLKASPSGHAAPLHVDISLPFKVHGRRDPPAEQLTLLRLPDGSIKVRHVCQHIDTGLSMQQRLDGIFKLLHKEQRKLLWASVKQALETEAAGMEAGDTTHALIQKMVSSAAAECPGTQELAAMLLDCYVKASQADSSRGRGDTVSILKPAIGWLQHSMLRQEVEAALQALASSTAGIQFSWMPVPGPVTSVALLQPSRGPSFSLIITEEKLYLEGPFSENSEIEGVGRQRRSHPGRKQLRKDQLHSLPELIRAA